ncbi:MAG: hypothetical protein IPI05_05500 [Flavobacteriales bacterium]|nr:hypothetical protein [Flavobacteriales bacterium]
MDLFCIGTEMQAFVQARPIYWNKLIDKISDTFQGPLTYAANWDEASSFPFWGRMDHIGVDGYYPICDKVRPTLMELEAGWRQHADELERLSTVEDRPVLFTEMGYCCTSDCAARPWSSDPEAPLDEPAQAQAWQAFFNVYADKPWYAGCFVWKWFAYVPKDEARRGNGFSRQGSCDGRPAVGVQWQVKRVSIPAPVRPITYDLGMHYRTTSILVFLAVLFG